MAVTVREIMNPELFTLRDTVRAEDALDALLALEINAAPVVDADRKPIGVSTLRDLVLDGIKPAISVPALAIAADLSIEAAARMMAESGHHHLVVVGSDGRVVGMVSSYDLVRALVGLPPKFPPTFPHRDAILDVTWTDIVPFDVEHVDAIPRGAGVLVLSTGGAGRREADLWVEATAALRARCCDLLELPHDDELALARVLARDDLRIRCSVIDDAARRARVADRLHERFARATFPRDVVPAEGE